ncbi:MULTISPECIES: flavodoxin family protein [Robinsoniella]|uniref:flavodoxin family protein n=1 Tax=Robinsoniella TaxID=588605 RepID=UPI000484A5F4|nr:MULTISPECIES: flavodoxin family protein [Robinsoniella]
MEKKVFVFVGSRSSKKKTYLFAEKILCEINRVEKIQYEFMTLNDFKIHPCMGCENCFTSGKCVQKDDLEILKEKMLSADVIVFAAPVYMQGMPGEVKNIIDRLATWAHTFRLAGKNVILVSTCDTNGHTSVVDDLHLKLLYMGARIVDKYIGANFLPDGLGSNANFLLLSDMEMQLPHMVESTINKWNKRFETNRFHESLFARYRELQKALIDSKAITGETEYWLESGMLECENYEEYLNSLLL